MTVGLGLQVSFVDITTLQGYYQNLNSQSIWVVSHAHNLSGTLARGKATTCFNPTLYNCTCCLAHHAGSVQCPGPDLWSRGCVHRRLPGHKPVDRYAMCICSYLLTLIRA